MTQAATTDLPAWIEAYAQECRALFGIGDDWHIVVKLVRAPDGDLEKEGHSSVNIRYLTARIEILESMSVESIRSALMHELLHVAFAPLELAYLRICDLIDEALRPHASELQADGIEQTIERLTRALRRQIKPSTSNEATGE